MRVSLFRASDAVATEHATAVLVGDQDGVVVVDDVVGQSRIKVVVVLELVEIDDVEILRFLLDILGEFVIGRFGHDNRSLPGAAGGRIYVPRVSAARRLGGSR